MEVGDSVGLLAAVTALLAAGARYGAVLNGSPGAAVERTTALGFFAGVLLGAGLLAVRATA